MAAPVPLPAARGPVVVLLDDGDPLVEARRVGLERSGMKVVLASELFGRIVREAMESRQGGSQPALRTRPARLAAALVTAHPATTVSLSRAARLLRASTHALRSWLDAGWLTEQDASSGKHLVDLREALLVAGLRYGIDRVPDEVADGFRLQRRAPSFESDPCLKQCPEWANELQTLSTDDLESVLDYFHGRAYSCEEIGEMIRRLSRHPRPPSRRGAG